MGFSWSYAKPVFVVCVMFMLTAVSGQNGGQRELVPAMFIFGDSLIDNGNNNDLPSFAKANYFPYGIDFNGGPTGRFSNGYTMVDEIAELLGLPLIPPYSQASGDQVLHGVNYASAAAGILDATGRNFVGRIPFDQQISNFQNTLNQITDNLGADDVARALAHCIFFVGMGSNDYLNNYLMPNYPTRNQYNGLQFANLLVQQYNQKLLKLYNLGARKFVIAGLGLMGCIPSILAQSTVGSCSQEVNLLVQPFNANVKAMVNNLNANLPGAKFIFVDVARMFQDLLVNSRRYGFTVVNRGCCGIGRNRGQITCLPFQTPCPNRNQYVFWDAFHPTEAVNILMGKKAFSGDRSIVYPMNIEQLARLEVQPNIELRGYATPHLNKCKAKSDERTSTRPTIRVPRKKSKISEDEDSLVHIDPELRYSFQRNCQFLRRVFSIDTIVKPLPPTPAYNVSHNLNFFTRIFTQFFDPEGIANAQKSLGIGQEEKVRRVR